MRRKLFVYKTALFAIFFFLIAGSVMPGDSYDLKYKMKKGKILHYTVTNKMQMLQEMMGAEMETESESTAKVALMQEATGKNGNLTFIMTYESMVMKVFSPMIDSTFENPTGLVGKRVRKTIAPDGDQVHSEELDKIDLGLLAQSGTLASAQEFLPNLPKGRLKTGENVEVTDIDSVNIMGGTTISKTEIDFTIIGTEPRAGYNCVKISMKGTVSVEGNGARQGMKFAIEGDGDVQRTLYFAPAEGVLVASESQSDVELTAALTGQMSMTIPITQSTKASMTLVK